MSLPFTDATLNLSMPLSGMPSWLRTMALVGILVAFAYVVRRLYHSELRLVSRGPARILLLLRFVLLAGLLLLLVLDPRLTRTRSEEVPARVMVAIDLSDSLRVTDPNRPPAEKLRLAMTLKLAADLAGDGDLQSWARAAESGSPMKFGSDGERTRYEAVIARVDATPRLEICRRLLDKDGLNLLEKLKEKHAVELLGFNPELQAISSDAVKLKEALTLPPPSMDRPMTCTDLKLPLARATETAGDGESSGTKLLGVVLLTDGRHNWGDGPLPLARELGDRSVPVFSIAVAPKDAPPDVAILSARAAAANVFKGSTVPIDVAVRVSGWPVGKLPVTLTRPDGKSLTEEIDHKGPDAVYQLTFQAKMEEPGPQYLTAKVDAGPKDRFPENNARNVRVNVVKDRAKVLLIDGDTRWEFHYLHTCLGRDPNMDVRSIVFRQPRIGKVNEAELKSMGIPARKMPTDLDALSTYDVIVLGDVELSQMTKPEREAIEKYVAESGGTLVLSAGKRAMPLAYGTLEDDPFRKLLPIKNPEAVDSVEGFPLTFTPAGDRSWFFAMGDTPGDSKAAWEKLPNHFWGVTGELKDGAEALVLGPKGQPLIARQNFGFGRVLYLGIDSTWRWRFKTGDYFHHRFWGQVAQWAASDRLLPVSNAAGTIRFGPREPVYSGGQDVEIIVRAAESVKPLGPQALKAVRVMRLPNVVGGKETTAGFVPLTVPDGRPRDLQAKLRDLTPGKYAVELDIPEWSDQLIGSPGADGRAEKLRATFEVVPPDNEEMIDLSANLPLLTQLAEAGGGRVFTPANATELVDLFAAQTATRQIRLDKPVRQSWWTFGLILSLLAAEWSLRKWYGLP
ncbi:hypothetical protein BH11PLA2_BH11PLA2_00100 [soil metagenome]